MINLKFKVVTNTLIKINSLNRLLKRLIMMLIDSIFIISALLFSFTLRLDHAYWPKTDELFFIIFGAPLIAIPIFITFKIYHSIARYIGAESLYSITQAVTLYAVIWGLFVQMANIEGIPRSVILINWMLSILSIAGLRIFIKIIFKNKIKGFKGSKKNVVIYGAGVAGRQLSNSLKLSTEYKHVSFIDDNPVIFNSYINNILVSPVKKLEFIINKNNVSEIFIALPSISRKKRTEIIKKLTIFSVQVKSLPSVSEIAGGNVKIDNLLEVDITDLLGRSSVSANKNLLKINITNKIVMVTGAGGSIGSELCRQILSLKPKKIILFEISEAALYLIDQELNNSNKNNVEIFSILGSVRDFLNFKKTIKSFSVETIYHAAAYKHVPLVESNPVQGLLNNSIGTMYAAKAAIEEKVETFVLISTDKAVRPTNIMGASKRIAELALQGLSARAHKTCLSMVRFGNVLNSSGSVIPLFTKQIKNGGPITLTDVNIERYFMTIPEAVELVIQSGAMGHSGDVFVLDMGNPIKIYDLALKMINLSGLRLLDKENPDGDIEIIYTGLRPGEKLYEELLIGKKVLKTEHDLIIRAQEDMIDWDILDPLLSDLNNALNNGEIKKIESLVKELVPEFKPKK
jgi:FlaA1/EpsC-like NDP-sugar epimerase